ncbi:MAG: hypothetical protein ACM3JB_13605 [Acidobacteriaceae bacterium]
MIDLATSNQPVTTSVHAFVAPMQRESNLPTIFDPAQADSFEIENPPAPWIGLGTVEEFQRTAVDESTSVQSGTDATVVAQFRKKLEAHVRFAFRRWGKLQLAMATGGTHWNVLASDPDGQVGPTGGEAIPALPVLAESTATTLKLDPGVESQLAVGDTVAVDLDYMQQLGYIGVGFPGAYVGNSSSIPPQTDFIRRITFNLAKVASLGMGTVTLEHPLPAGDPPTSARLQKVVGFTDREGGAFRQEWSALFFENTVSGGRVCYYYPRLQSLPQASEKKNAILADYQAILLQAHLLALPATDPQDGVSALWYRTYIPPKE